MPTIVDESVQLVNDIPGYAVDLRAAAHGPGAPVQPGGAGVVRVREERETLTAGLPAEPVFVVVRPDHYVAAVFTPGDQDRVVQELRTHLDDRVRAARQPTA